MSERVFVAYVKEPDVHDGTIIGLERFADTLRVYVKIADGRVIAIEFHGIQSVSMNRAEGMMLYSLSEMTASPPFRCYVFTNWNEGDDAHLEVVAQGIRQP